MLKIFCLDIAKKVICRIEKGAETAVYQARLLKRKMWPSILVKKNLASYGVWRKKSSFNINWKKSSVEKKSSRLPPQITKWSLHKWDVFSEKLVNGSFT